MHVSLPSLHVLSLPVVPSVIVPIVVSFLFSGFVSNYNGFKDFSGRPLFSTVLHKALRFERAPRAAMPSGVWKQWCKNREGETTYGFITRDGGEDLFCYIKDLEVEQKINKGDKGPFSHETGVEYPIQKMVSKKINMLSYVKMKKKLDIENYTLSGIKRHAIG